MAGKVTVWATVSMVLVLSAGCVIQRQYKAKDIYERGLAEYSAGNYTSAAGDFKWAIELKREYAGPMLGLAQCHLQFARENFARKNTGAALENLIEARFRVDQALDAAPGNPEVTRTRVEIMKLSGDLEQAIKTADWGASVQGPNPSSLLLKAKTYQENGAYDEAEVAYKQAIAVAPANVEARVQAAKFYEKIGKRDLALQQYEEAWRIDPSNSEAQLKISQMTGSAPEPQSRDEVNVHPQN